MGLLPHTILHSAIHSGRAILQILSVTLVCLLSFGILLQRMPHGSRPLVSRKAVVIRDDSSNQIETRIVHPHARCQLDSSQIAANELDRHGLESSRCESFRTWLWANAGWPSPQFLDVNHDHAPKRNTDVIFLHHSNLESQPGSQELSKQDLKIGLGCSNSIFDSICQLFLSADYHEPISQWQQLLLQKRRKRPMSKRHRASLRVPKRTIQRCPPKHGSSSSSYLWDMVCLSGPFPSLRLSSPEYQPHWATQQALSGIFRPGR